MLYSVLMLSCALGLTACGGGGGGSGGGSTSGGNDRSETRAPSPAPTPNPTPQPEDSTEPSAEPETSVPPEPERVPPSPPVFPASHYEAHPEYQNQIGLAISHAAEAYARNLSGEGIVIGFTDTGLAADHPEFADDRVILNDRSGYGATTPTSSQLFHGTAVASIAAGQRGSGDGMHGVAYNSDIAMWSLALQTNGTLDVDDDIFSRALIALNEHSPAAINHSWGYAIQFDPTHAGTQRSFLLSDFANSIRKLGIGNAIHVWSAGNESGSEVSITAAFPLLFPELRNRSIVVVSVDGNGEIGQLSNHCGAAKAICIAAPGGNNAGAQLVNAALAGGGYTGVIGTSFAAPHVSAALAILRELFGAQLSNQELLERLFFTADNSGIYADEDIYGHGLLDLAAATHPVGPTGVSVGDRKISVDDSSFNFRTFNAGLKTQLKNEEIRIIIHDSLDAPFSVPLSIFSQEEDKKEALTEIPPIAKPTPRPTARWSFASGTKAATWQTVSIADMTALVSQGRYGARPQPTLLRSPFMELAGIGAIGQIDMKGWQLTSFANWKESIDEREDPLMVSGFSAAWRAAAGPLTLGVNGGIMFEEDAILGGQGRGAFALNDYGRTLFTGIGGEMPLAFGWQSAFAAYFGQTEENGAKNGLIESIDTVAASSFSASVWKQLGALSVYAKLDQPLRVDNGKMHFQLPVARLPGGGVVMEDWALPLSPDGRELRGELGMRQFTNYGQFSLRVQVRHEPEHVRHAADEFAASAGWQLGF